MKKITPLGKAIMNLQHSNYLLPKQDSNSYISFIEGFLLGQQDKKLKQNISSYINKVYKINIEYNTWMEQLDEYTYYQNKDMNLLAGFINVLKELESYTKEEIKEENNKYSIVFPSEEDFLISNVEKQVLLKNNMIIAEGDFVKLSDKIGLDYRKTKFYDKTLRNPSWSLFYPSTKDFQHIYFYKSQNDNKITNFGKVRRIFSESMDQIKFIVKKEKKVILYTNLFKIALDDALLAKECKILKRKNKIVEINNFSGLSEQFEYYITGLIDFENLIGFWCFNNLHFFNKKWHRFRRTINGEWHEIPKI